VVPQRPPELNWKLVPAKDVPPRMVKVGGGRYRIAAWARPTNEIAALDDFFIDQFEVTNREFKEFIDAGGYERRELWKHPFVKGGKTLTYDEAMLQLKDTTGLNAPRRWVNQSYPEGRDDYPVTDVTWYEAAAYAAFRGKTLPTIYQWDKAARDGKASPFGAQYPWGVAPVGQEVPNRAHFRGNGPMPVTALASGMSAYGAYHMAGNVAEWCSNGYGDGMTATGGDFNSPTYAFGNVAAVPATHSDSTLGFRCAKVIGTPKGDQGGGFIPFTAVEIEFNPVGDAEFAKIARLYDYPDEPLAPRVVERKMTAAWTMEKIEYAGANGQRALAYLYLPRHAKPPYQVVHLVPASDVDNGFRSLESAMESMLQPVLGGGRACFGVVLRGYIGRRTGDLEWHSRATPEYGDRIVERVTDLRRGIDYLVSRPDIDKTRIGFYGPSAGASLGMVHTALEKRYRSLALTGLGFDEEEKRTIAYASRMNFAPRVTTPKLMVHGRWDESHPLQSEAMPVYRLFPEPKRLVVVDAGHIPPPDVFMRLFVNWLDETMGKVQR
jgi:eukaryotic-like serine/threonine-protein kinase